MLRSLWKAGMIVLNAWIFTAGILAFLYGAYNVALVAAIFNLFSLTGTMKLWKE
jgi:hypothetical protein